MKSSPYGNLCAALCSETKTKGNITKTTDDERGGKENKEILKKETCFLHGVNSVSNLAFSAGACVEQLHVISVFLYGVNFTNLQPFT